MPAVPNSRGQAAKVRHLLASVRTSKVRIMDEETGEVRIEIGEQVVFLGPTEVTPTGQRVYLSK